MKYSILLIQLICIAFLPAKSQNIGNAVLNGKINGFAQTPLVIHNDKDNYDTLSVASDGSFSFTHSLQKPSDCYLYIVDDSITSPFCLYEKPGQSLYIDLTWTDTGIIPSYAGDTGYESLFNHLLQNLCSLSQTFSTESWLKISDFNSCKEYVTKKFLPLKKLLHSIKDSTFVSTKYSILNNSVPYYYIDYAIAKQKNGTEMKKDKDYMDFTKQINLNDTTNIALISHYLNWVILMDIAYSKTQEKDILRLKYAKQLINNQAVRNKLVEEAYRMILFTKVFGGKTSADATITLYQEMINLSTDKNLCRNIEQMLKKEKNLTKNAPAAKMVINDQRDNIIYLTDIVGNGHYTYIDFWATWCGPCCKEIPYLASLVEKYKDNSEIHFVSISLDENKEAWIKKITNDNPKWEQYRIPEKEQKEWDSMYEINTIPRFMLFDKEGHIIDAYAPRPSDPETDKLIQSFL